MFRHISKLPKNISKFNAIIPKLAYHSNKTIPDLTKERYPVERGNYATINDKDIQFFESIVSSTRCITDTSDIEAHNIDFLGAVRGYSQVLIKPKTTQEVSAILRHCNERKIAVCPQGGNTGLVGGSVPVFDEIILSMQLMNQIEYIDETAGILVCQSGCILEKLEEHVSEKGLCMPIDLGAKGTCHIGGNVSTNAGGLRLLRYGNLHGNVLSVEAVKADGTILDLMSHFKKDNTGYHLKHLFIGSEGTLGVITKLAIACPTAPKAVNVAFLGLESYEAVMKTFLAAKHDLGEILSACELIDKESLRCSVRNFNLKSPIEEYPFHLLIETSGSNGEHDEEKVTKFLEAAMNRGDIIDGTVASENSKIQQIWQLRELIATAMVKEGYVFKYDLSLPLTHFYEIVPAMRERVGNLATTVCGYGHVGDSNLHLNVSCKEFTDEIYKRVEPFVYEYTAKLKGSVSAEHGIGFLKTNYLKYSKQPDPLILMKELKTMMDPNGILNPYKVLPKQI